METRRSKRIKLQNERKNQDGSNDSHVQGKGINQKTNLSDDSVVKNYEHRAAEEHQIIHSVGLPMICWEQGMITAHLQEESSDSLETLMNSSPYFRELFKDKRIFFLSEKVFKILSTWLPKKGKYKAYQKNLLHCRLVCKTWCSSFDKAVQNQLQSRRSEDEGLQPDIKSSVIKFRQHFENTHPPSTSRSPLINRQLTVLILKRETEVTWNRTLSILQDYGDHIWHLHLQIACNAEAGLTPHRTYLLFRETLMLTPNLKTLYIIFDDSSINSYSKTTNFNYESLTLEKPLPKLPNLQTLGIQQVPRDILSHIMRQNDHIPKLKLPFFNHRFDSNIKLDNLSEFDLGLHWSSEVPVAGAKWPVKKLNLNVTNVKFKWNQQIFENISHNWGEHCEEMKLFIHDDNPRNFTLQKCVNCRFDFPKLKILDVKMNGDAISIDVFLEVKSLEHIRIIRNIGREPCDSEDDYYDDGNVWEKRRHALSKIIQFNGYKREMYESNIWNHFPKLKYFEVDGIKYRRAEWIERSKKTQGKRGSK